MRIAFDVADIRDYRRFLQVRKLPTYRFKGDFCEFPDEYAARISGEQVATAEREYTPSAFLFDYQRDICRMAVNKRRFCVFADCGLGKTLIFLDYVRHVLDVLPPNQCALIVSPLMVIGQTLAEVRRWYGDTLPIEQVQSGKLGEWLWSGGRVGITNYEAFSGDEIERGRLGCLILDESSMLKSHYGKWGTSLVKLGRGVEWKMALTGTPAPNDRIEYANHAVLMDAFPTVNSFLARYFINRGQTENRWELKQHALGAFYRSLSHWCIFLTNPKRHGWKDHGEELPPIKIHVHDVSLTAAQRDAAQSDTGELFVVTLGGITSRSRLATISKGFAGKERIETNKTKFIADLIAHWPNESTIVWCKYNEEQAIIREAIPHAESISGDTPLSERLRIIEAFKAGECRVLISKPKILGFGLNLQQCTRMVFSGLQDSYEEFYQAIKRANRFGSTNPLNVHLPITEIERPMIDTVLRKAERVAQDADEQEKAYVAATK